MSVVSESFSAELAGSKNALERVYSEETDESPFASNLVTPTDDESYPCQGIHERLGVAETVLGYFASKDFAAESGKTQAVSHHETPERLDVVEIEGHPDDSQETDETTPLLATLDSTATIASPFSSESSSESIRRPRVGSIYTLPNDHIVVESSLDGLNENPQEDSLRQLLESDSIPIIRRPDLGPKFWLQELEPMISTLTFRAFISISFRLVCFLPWCVAVGGALVLSPEHLDYIAFHPGYIENLSGIRRYAYWAEYGYQHIIAFLGFLGVLTWMFPTAGLVLIGGLLAQLCIAWHAFLVDRNIPLGEDDKQSVFLLATSSWLDDTSINIRKVGDSYYSTAIATKEDYGKADDSN